jgi:hypothetical protein
MTTKYTLSPDVPGEMGTNTITDHRFTPFKVYHLQFVFDSYPDDIFTSFPAYVVSEDLFNKIIDSGFTGIDNARLITYLEREDYLSEERVNQNYFMVDIATDITNDFYFDNNIKKLIVSERALTLLKKFRIRFADIENYSGN